MDNPKLKLKQFTFEQLFKPQHLQELDTRFLALLQMQNSSLHHDLISFRHDTHPFTPIAVSELLLACAPLLEEFIADLFGIEEALACAVRETLSDQPIFAFKQWYVQRQAKRRLLKQDVIETFLDLDHWLDEELKQAGLFENDRELMVATLGVLYLAKPEQYAQQIEQLTCWCVRAMSDVAGKMAVKGWVSFHLPQKLDYYNLVPMCPVPDDTIGRYEGPCATHRARDGFKLTDPRMTKRQVLNEIDYCVYCHEHDGDFCSKGFPFKKGEPDKGFKTNPLDEVEVGCPLEEKISEMHLLKKEGRTIAALAMIMVDNPMCPATGHRICNDCMKACIYQKQDPVNIPQAETGILTDVLALPWGVEIYDLLTRWNPLRQTQWVAKPYNGLKVLIMGMGPAGFTLAHHLLMEGFAVVGADGLKIEPLPMRFVQEPIYRYEDIKEELDTRIMAGFGGVAEYGITVRWDKNFLKLIYITLSRRPYFQVFGGVRLGGTILVEDAWQLGFDHMAIAVGAGLPKELPIPGSLAPGMRQANDFLMALQLTGAAKKNGLANLQVRLPAVVIGGGLTGIDTATEVQAYYISQVEKILERYEILKNAWGEAYLHEQFDSHSLVILTEFLTHGLQVREERARKKNENNAVDFTSLIREWGGVTVVYRGLLRDSPAYKRNHEEVIKAFEEGIYYAQGLAPKTVRLDQYGHVEALISESRLFNENGEWQATDEKHVLPARSILVATGARPNIAYEFEHRGTFHREGPEYQAYDSNGHLQIVHPHGHCKIKDFGPFTSYQHEGHRVTFLGDTHPLFHGNVVKAIASGKRTYPKIVHSLGARVSAQGDDREYQTFAQNMSDQFSAVIVQIKRCTPCVLELQVRAPIATRNYHPGQFYRVQNYETSAQNIGNTLLQTESIAALGVNVDKEKGVITMLILQKGASSRLFSTFECGDAIALMGPTGARNKIPHDKETVLVIGGKIAAAYVCSIGPTMRAAGNRVLYIAGFHTAEEVYYQHDLEQATDKIIWSTCHGAPIVPGRAQDRAMSGDLMSALLSYAHGELDDDKSAHISLQTVNRVLVVGSPGLLQLIQQARKTVLEKCFAEGTKFIGSIYSPMQCMLKGVCAQCLTWQIDPHTGQRVKAVFACSWQDQPLEIVDLDNLDDRLIQNRAQEILSNLWLDYLFERYQINHI